jgi:FemAB-related protein (PEP-CTERM system-associated)
MNQLNIRLAIDSDQPKWDAYVASHPNAGPYHLYGWKTATEKAYGHKGYYLLAEDDSGSVVGVLPLICFKMPWGRKTLISLPYCDYAGPIGEPRVRQTLILECRKLACELSASEIELRCPAGEDSLASVDGANCRILSHKVRMLLALPGSSDGSWSGFKSKLRSQVRRPQKEGLAAAFGSADLLEDFYSVFSVNMRDLGSPVHARHWFEDLLAAYGENARIAVVYTSTGEPVASGILLLSGRKACVPWASALRKYNRVAPNMLLYWTFLEWSADNGFAEFDFGRSTVGEGTYRFKQQWGTRPQQLYWYRPGLNGQEAAHGDSGSKSRETAAHIWQHLPICIADRVGPRVRKYISL